MCRRPELGPQFFPGDYVTGTLKQKEQNLQGLLLEFNFQSGLVQLPRTHVHLEYAKAHYL